MPTEPSRLALRQRCELTRDNPSLSREIHPDVVINLLDTVNLAEQLLAGIAASLRRVGHHPESTEWGEGFEDRKNDLVIGVECLIALKEAAEQRAKEAETALGEARKLLVKAKIHTWELRESWERGIITEHDAQGGTRSNRNADLDVELCKFLKLAKGTSE